MNKQTLDDLLDYNQESGVFTWKTGARAGRVAGYKHPHGYTQIWLLGKPYYAHRLAWLLIYGSDADQHIDHIDGDKANNAIANLRLAGREQNMQNQRVAHVNNKTQLLGVSAKRGKWRAAIKCNGKTLHLGTFDTPEKAHEAYVEAKRRLHSGCTI